MWGNKETWQWRCKLGLIQLRMLMSENSITYTVAPNKQNVAVQRGRQDCILNVRFLFIFCCNDVDPGCRVGKTCVFACKILNKTFHYFKNLKNISNYFILHNHTLHKHKDNVFNVFNQPEHHRLLQKAIQAARAY